MREVIYISYESFEKLEEAKKQSIINAGFKVFGENGFKKASVEEIIKDANISKGSLFYYFESKKNFYIYLYEYSGQQMEQLIDSPGEDGRPSYMKYTDFFERLNAIQLLKMKHSVEFPYMYDFMKKSIFETEPQIKGRITKINQKYIVERAMLFFQGLDYSKFKDGIDPKMVIQLITWCSEGCANQVMIKNKLNPAAADTVPDFNEIIEMYNSYVRLIRNNFYKEEYL
jgi:AcrR family transcriptional regulator